MKAQEAILRCLSFQIFDYQNEYKGELSEFLEKTMRKINLATEEEIEIIRKDFKRVMELTYDFFGDVNFRIPTDGTRGRVNIAVMESVYFYFVNKSDTYLKTNKLNIKKNFKILLEDGIYLNAVRFSTGGKNNVVDRFKRTQEILSQE